MKVSFSHLGCLGVQNLQSRFQENLRTLTAVIDKCQTADDHSKIVCGTSQLIPMNVYGWLDGGGRDSLVL